MNSRDMIFFLSNRTSKQPSLSPRRRRRRLVSSRVRTAFSVGGSSRGGGGGGEGRAGQGSGAERRRGRDGFPGGTKGCWLESQKVRSTIEPTGGLLVFFFFFSSLFFFVSHTRFSSPSSSSSSCHCSRLLLSFFPPLFSFCLRFCSSIFLFIFPIRLPLYSPFVLSIART